MIRIQDLHKRFGAHEILTGVTADVAKGEIIGIVGPSGVGKSTLLRCLNYLEPFHAGRVEIAGFELHPGLERGHAETLRALRSTVGMVFQQFNLFPHLTALQNVTLAPRVAAGRTAAECDAEARELLKTVGLADKAFHYPSQLSGGQQQRVAIARALAQHPKVLLFDEPTSALDPAMKQEVLDVMQRLARDGMTMLVVTHEMRFARGMATRIWEMNHGKIVRDGTPQEILKDHD